jgi:glutathione synthase/RimK-type ligase-like ATP-grasp enzyme
MKLLAPHLEPYAGQQTEQKLLAESLEKQGIIYTPCQVKEGVLPEGEAIFWQGISGYHHQMALFESLLKQAEARRIISFNTPDMMRWNAKKTYLRELEKKGVSVIPTLWLEGWDSAKIKDWAAAEKYETLIIKPAISAGAFLTYQVKTNDKVTLKTIGEEYTKSTRNTLMIQPFCEEIISEGEWSFLFFDGIFSHAVLKTPKAGDYRIQHVHGGTYRKITPESNMLKKFKNILSHLPEKPFYARVDGIQRGGEFLLMEVELIEPYFYLDAAPEQADFFAKAMKEKLS